MRNLWKIINGQSGIRAGRPKNFQKINKRACPFITNTRVVRNSSWLWTMNKSCWWVQVSWHQHIREQWSSLSHVWRSTQHEEKRTCEPARLACFCRNLSTGGFDDKKNNRVPWKHVTRATTTTTVARQEKCHLINRDAVHSAERAHGDIQYQRRDYFPPKKSFLSVVVYAKHVNNCDLHYTTFTIYYNTL